MTTKVVCNKLSPRERRVSMPPQMAAPFKTRYGSTTPTTQLLPQQTNAILEIRLQCCYTKPYPYFLTTQCGIGDKTQLDWSSRFNTTPACDRRTDRQSAHLWWPTVAKPQAASMPIAWAAVPWDKQTDGSHYSKMPR